MLTMPNAFPEGTIAIAHSHPRALNSRLEPGAGDNQFRPRNGLRPTVNGRIIRINWNIILDQRGVLFMDLFGNDDIQRAENNWYQYDHYGSVNCDDLVQDFNP